MAVLPTLDEAEDTMRCRSWPGSSAPSRSGHIFLIIADSFIEQRGPRGPGAGP